MTYTVIPTGPASTFCVGAGFTIVVTVNPNPVGGNTTVASVCSSVGISVDPQTNITNGLTSTFAWVRSLPTGLTQVVGGGGTGSGVITETLRNLTGGVLNAVYTVTPTSAGCTGPSFTIIVPVDAEPVGVNTTVASVCSSTGISVDPQLAISNGVASTFSWNRGALPGGLTQTAGATSGSTVPITGTFRNTSNGVLSVVYTVTPTSVTGSCLGVSYTITVPIQSEPVGNNASPAAICSDAAVNYNLQTNVNSGPLGNSQTSTFSWLAADNANVTGESLSAQNGVTINDVLLNVSGSDQVVVYTVTPTGTNGCVGSTFTVSVTVKSKPVGISTTTSAFCSGAPFNILPAIGNGMSASFTWTATYQPGLTGGSGSGIGNLAETLENASSSPKNATYIVVPTGLPPLSNGCVGGAFTIIVPINPISVGIAQSVVRCSDEITNVLITTTGSSAPASSFNISVNPNGLTQIAGTDSNGTLKSNTEIQSDAWLNTTSLPVNVVYTITPVSSFGSCVGNPFDIIINVKPKPIGINQTITQCSDVVTNYNLIVNVALLGNNVGSSFSWVAAANSNVAGESTSIQSGSIITDVLNNVSNTSQTVVYDVTPTGVNGCAGAIFQVSVIVKPEPVGTILSAPTVCSDSPVNYSLQGNINLSNGIPSTFTWIAANNPSITGASTVSFQSTSILSDVLVNTSLVPQVVTYTIYPTGVNGCAGNMFTVNVTVNPKAQITAGMDLALCRDIPSIALQGGITYAPNGVVWTGATGTYSNNLSPVSNYSFNNPSEINQTLVLTLTANDPDGTGPCLSVSDQMNLKINQLPSPAILNSSTSVVQNSPNFTITGANAGGIFTIAPGFGLSGTTVTNISGNLFDVATFNPSSATVYDGTLPTINKVTYTFTDANGCTGSNSINVIVNPVTVNDFRLEYSPNNQVPFDGIDIFSLCSNSGKILIRGTPPVTLGLGPETSIMSVPIFLGGPVAPISFDGTNYFLETDGLPSDTYRILYTYKNNFGAINIKTHDVRIFATPVAKIATPTNSCVEFAIDLNDNSNMPPINVFGGVINKYNWNFGVPGVPGATTKNTSYNYSAPGAGGPGEYDIRLDIETDQGCRASTTLPIRVGDVPVANYNWKNVCTNDQTEFKDATRLSPATISKIIKYTWDFGDGDVLTTVGPNDLLTVPGGTHSGRTSGTYKDPKHNFTTPGPKAVLLKVQTDDGCDNTITQTVTILLGGSTVQPTQAAPYFNNFNALVDNEWFRESKVISAVNVLPVVYGVNSWLRGTPNGSTIKPAASGSKAWWTGENILGSPVAPPTYYQREDSWVNGPCFDLSQLERPMVALDYWSDAERNIDGAALQYSTDGGVSWQLVGPLAGESIDQGINWYNEKGLPSNPGQQSFGWTDKQGKWKNARYNLDIVPKTKRDKVRLRVAFGSNDGNESSTTYDGFAFDNFFVGDKKRLVLMEHFTNSSLSGSVDADNYVNNLYSEQINLVRPGGQSDFNDIQYHISYSSAGSDLLNSDNPNDPNARASSYGVSQPPKTFIDGIRNQVFDGTFTKLNKIEVDRRALKAPKFSLKLDTTATTGANRENFINVRLTMVADTIVNTPLIAQVALVEDDVVTPAGTFKNVLRKLLFGSDPTKPDGITITQTFTVGQSAVRPAQPAPDVEINVPISKPNNLKLIGFVQDKNTGEIYQSTIMKVKRKVGSVVVGLEDDPLKVTNLKDLQIFPNPANGKFNFGYPGSFPDGYIWKIADQRGIFVLTGDFAGAVNGIKSIDVSMLASGVYYVLIGAEGKVPVYRKLVVMN
ncbi:MULTISPECIES: PKD-like domain-containing protein [unclassified Microcystis]|uniref:PKD-like domain-containing protein n=1 Tax=unclassified Microcystis TaxID=2643300 RepID=UPI00338F0DCA